MRSSIIFLFILLAILASCGPSKPEEISKQTLFKLQLGTLEDEMNLFTNQGPLSREPNRLYFYEGILFIANGPAKKVMEFNSYGDLLTIFYNPETNPQPVQASVAKPDARLRSRRAVSYNFQQIGEIAAGRDRIFIRDRLPAERRVFDENLGVSLDQVVLRFDRKGNFVDFVGQEGVGGKAFPNIQRIQVNENNEWVVFCRTPSTWPIYWYSPSGALAVSRVIELSKLPLPQEKDPSQILTNVENIFGDWNSRRVYIQISYYEKIVDEVTKIDSGVGLFQSRVYTYNMDNGNYESFFPVPRLFYKEKKPGSEETFEQELPYEFLGQANGGKFFFLSASDNGDRRLLIVDDRGRILAEKNIRLSEKNLILNQIFVNPQGVLSALLSDGEEVEVAVWRSDKVTGFLNVQNPFK